MKFEISVKIFKNIFKENIAFKRGNLKVVIILILSVLALTTVYIFVGYKNNSNIASIIYSKQVKEEVSKTNLEKLSTKIWLPKESKAPRIFEISDPVQLAEEQSFYEGATIGDILVIFDESKKAIIYSPTRDIIINTGTFSYVDDNISLLLSQ